MPTVWLVTGNKGGVGKSVVAMALVSRLVQELRQRDGIESRQFRTGVGVVDGDGRTPDVAAMCSDPIVRKDVVSKTLDFRQLRPESSMSMVEQRYMRVLRLFAKAGVEHIVINTPDGADDQILRWFQMMVKLDMPEVSNADGVPEEWYFKVLFVMSPSQDGLEYLLPISMMFDLVYPVRNLFFGQSGRWEMFDRQLADCFDTVIDFPTLPGREMDLLKARGVLPGLVGDWRGIDGKGLPLLTRARGAQWDLDVGEALFEAIDSIRPTISDANTEEIRKRVEGLMNGGGSAIALADLIAQECLG